MSLYMDYLKLLGRSKGNLQNEIKTVKTTSKGININSGLQKCAKTRFKKDRVQSKTYIGSTFKGNKERDLRKPCIRHRREP